MAVRPNKSESTVPHLYEVILVHDKLSDQVPAPSELEKQLGKLCLETVHKHDLQQKVINVVQRRMCENGRGIRETQKYCTALEDLVKEMPYEMVTVLDTDVILDEDTALYKEPKRFSTKASDFAVSDDCRKVAEALCFSEKTCKFFDKWYH